MPASDNAASTKSRLNATGNTGNEAPLPTETNDLGFGSYQQVNQTRGFFLFNLANFALPA